PRGDRPAPARPARGGADGGGAGHPHRHPSRPAVRSDRHGPRPPAGLERPEGRGFRASDHIGTASAAWPLGCVAGHRPDRPLCAGGRGHAGRSTGFGDGRAHSAWRCVGTADPRLDFAGGRCCGHARVAPRANAAVLPLLPMVVAGGLLLAPLAAIPELGRLAALPITAVVTYLKQVAWVLARAPYAAFTVPSFPPWAGGAYYATVGGALAAVRTAGGKRLAALLLATGAPVLIVSAELVAWTRPAPAAAVLAVGDGQAVLLRGPQGTVLIDGGPSPARLADAVGARLPPWSRTLDALVI